MNNILGSNLGKKTQNALPNNQYQFQFSDFVTEHITIENIYTKFEQILNRYDYNLVQLAKENNIKVSEIVSFKPTKDVDSLPRILEEVIYKEQVNIGVPAGDFTEFRTSHSDLQMKRNTIIFCVKQRRPGAFQQANPYQAMSSESIVREHSYHRRGLFDDTNEPNYKLVEYGKIYDNKVQLTIASSNADSADRLALWLEDVIDKWRWYIMKEGINSIIYLERSQDDFESNSSNPLYKRHLIYYVRTEKIFTIKEIILQQIIHSIQLSKGEN